MVFSLYILTPS